MLQIFDHDDRLHLRAVMVTRPGPEVRRDSTLCDQSAAFAHVIDGHSMAGRVQPCTEIVRNTPEGEPDPNEPAASALQQGVAFQIAFKMYWRKNASFEDNNRIYTCHLMLRCYRIDT